MVNGGNMKKHKKIVEYLDNHSMEDIKTHVEILKRLEKQSSEALKKVKKLFNVK